MKDGGPAFPQPRDLDLSLSGYEQTGMSLRDYFAAKAMQTLIIYPNVHGEDVPTHAYAMADAMLKEREK